MISSFPTRRHFLAGSGAACLLTGCSSLISAPPPHLYTLTPPRDFAPDLPTVKPQLVIALPDAAQGFDTDRIALAHSATSFDYFADSIWVDRAPLMIQGLLVEAFENTGKIQAVARDSSDLHADYTLHSDLRDFEARYESPDQPPLVQVRLSVRLVRMQDRQIVGTFAANGQNKAGGNDLNSIVNTFNDTLSPVLRQIVEWSLRRL
ncbi:MAG TPA: ABC-type transport auxiliary lipoprotein family protein [Aliidongia sp.]|nr:ABC-type transport auxiliary lipoprotein family protein [Aliidongia sp.]